MVIAVSLYVKAGSSEPDFSVASRDRSLLIIEEDENRVSAEEIEDAVEPGLTILHFGDIMLDRNVKKQIDKNGEDYLFGKLEEAGIFKGNDIIAANLEGSFVTKKRLTSKSIAFGFDSKLIPMLQKYGFNFFALANNHSQDMTLAGFEENKKYLREAGIDFYGEQYSVDDDALLIKEVKGKKLAFIGINDTHTSVAMKRVLPLLEKVKQADWRIVNVHWGEEYKPVSNQHQREFAHALIDAGADIIIGHHPHVVQEVEIYKDKPIFYSLGNFIFDQYFSKETQEGLGIKLTLTNDRAVSARFYPLRGNLSQVELMTINDADIFMQKLVDRSRLKGYSMENYFLVIP